MNTDRNPVLDVTDSNYVLPSPPRGQGLLVTGQHELPPSFLHAGAIARELGGRFRLQAQSLELLLDEVRDRLERLDLSAAEDSRAQLKGAVREIVRVVDWCDAVQQELVAEASKASAGLEPIDLNGLCEQLATSLQGTTDPIAVSSKQPVTYWGDRAQLAHLVQKALGLVWARTGGRGLRCLEVFLVDGTACIRVCSRGEPVPEVDGELVDLFRAATANAEVLVVPDDLGPGGAGLVLRLPA